MGKPVVIIDRNLNNNNFYSIEIDNFNAVHEGISYLIKNGHKNIYYFSEPQNSLALQNRLKGYIRALADHSISFDRNKILTNQECRTEKVKGGYSLFMKIKDYIKPPIAIFATSDLIAYGAMKATMNSGFEIPKDVSFLGFDNIFLSEYMTPSLTTIKQPKRKMGKVCNWL